MVYRHFDIISNLQEAHHDEFQSKQLPILIAWEEFLRQEFHRIKYL